MSLNKLVDEWASMALPHFDTETRFNAQAARGNPNRGLALLNKLDRSFAHREVHNKEPKRHR